MTAYFPYALQDPRSLGWATATVPTRLGDLQLYRSPGTGTVETLFLHGVNLESSGWSPLLLEAGGGAAGWAFLDLPGFGGSAPLTHRLTLGDASAAVLDVLDAVGAGRVHVVGHSMGGFLALHLAAVAPDRVRSLTTVNGAYSTIVDVVNAPARTLVRAPRPTLMYAGLTLVARLGRVGTLLQRFGASTGLMRLSLRGLAAHPRRVPPSMLEALARGSRPRSFRYADQAGDGYDCAAVWSRIEVPVTALFGDADLLVGERDRRVLAAALPAATLTVVAEAGHLLPMEQPGILLEALRRAWGGAAP